MDIPFTNSFKTLLQPQWILLACFLFVYVIRLVYLLLHARLLFLPRPKTINNPQKSISLFVTFRNAENQVWKNLPALLEIKGVQFQVVAVDDYSHDNSLSVLGLLNQRYKHLKISMLSQETRFSTKLAQTVALKAADNEWVMQLPVNLTGPRKEWLQTVLSVIENNPQKQLVIAYCKAGCGTDWLSNLYRSESFSQFAKSAAWLNSGIAVVYSEENIAFKKEQYFKQNAYRKKLYEMYVNLELVFNKFASKKNTEIIFTEQAVVTEEKQIKRKDFFDLLKKRIRIEKNLPWLKQALLLADEWTALAFMVLSVLMLVLVSSLWIQVLVLLLAYVSAYLLIIKILQNRLNERKIFITSLVYGVLMPVFRIVYRWHFSRSIRNKWKKKG